MLYSDDNGKTWRKVMCLVPRDSQLRQMKSQGLLAVACTLAFLLNLSLSTQSKQGTPLPYNMAVVIPDITLESPGSFDFHEVDHPVTHSVAAEPSLFKEWMWYLKSREGFIPTEYKCPAGIPTIGYGHNIRAHGHTPETEDGVCTYKEASTVLYKDIQMQYDQVAKLLPHLTKNQKLAVTSLAANCGIAKIMYPGGNPKRGYSVFWQAVKQGRTPNFLVYTKYKTPRGKVVQSPNLVAARSFEQAMFKGAGPVKVWDGHQFRTLSFAQAAEWYRDILIKRDIVPAQTAGIYN